MEDHPIRIRIGRVTRCSIRGFDGGIQLSRAEVPTFGTLCRAQAQQGRCQVIGLIYDISIEDDELARQLAIAETPPPEAQIDNQFVRPVPIEIKALAVGYQVNDRYVQTLPPQPPLTLADILTLTPQEVRGFTDQLHFIRLVLSAAEVPADDLLVAALRGAAEARPADQRHRFLAAGCREIARLIGSDLTRLENILANLRRP